MKVKAVAGSLKFFLSLSLSIPLKVCVAKLHKLQAPHQLLSNVTIYMKTSQYQQLDEALCCLALQRFSLRALPTTVCASCCCIGLFLFRLLENEPFSANCFSVSQCDTVITEMGEKALLFPFLITLQNTKGPT
ncbi:hypothetical protein WN943_021703 [Citrus x changshan-huyou]